tara:strand:- start:888 stop:1136 length:249 start_codon:yes stop_codon:yes gene_type:complete
MSGRHATDKVKEYRNWKTRMKNIYKEIEPHRRTLTLGSNRTSLDNCIDLMDDAIGCIQDIINNLTGKPDYDFDKWEGTNGDS